MIEQEIVAGLKDAYLFDLSIIEKAFPHMDRRELLDYCLKWEITDLFKAAVMMEAERRS